MGSNPAVSGVVSGKLILAVGLIQSTLSRGLVSVSFSTVLLSFSRVFCSSKSVLFVFLMHKLWSQGSIIFFQTLFPTCHWLFVIVCEWFLPPERIQSCTALFSEAAPRSFPPHNKLASVNWFHILHLIPIPGVMGSNPAVLGVVSGKLILAVGLIQSTLWRGLGQRFVLDSFALFLQISAPSWTGNKRNNCIRP